MSFGFPEKSHNFSSFQIAPNNYFFEGLEQQQLPFYAEDESYCYPSQFNHHSASHSLPISHNISSHLQFSLNPSHINHHNKEESRFYLQQENNNNNHNNYSSSHIFTNTVATHNYYQYYQQATQQQQQQQQQQSMFVPLNKQHQYEWNNYESHQTLQDIDAVSQSTQELVCSPNCNCKPAALPSFDEAHYRRESLETKNEDTTDGFITSSNSPLLHPTSKIIPKTTLSNDNSEPTSSVNISVSQKQQSQLKNANKFCMVSLLNFLTDVLPNNNEVKHLIKYIIRVKGSGKMRQKVDIFTLSHFRVLFLTLNDWNITQLTPADVKIHKLIFSELAGSKGNSGTASWSKEDMEYMNYVKQQLLTLSLEFFEDASNIKQKIQSKAWQNEHTGKHYIEWVGRIAKGIKKMSSGVYIHRF